MKKFLKVLARHFLTIPFFAFCIVSAIIYWNYSPIILGLVCCVPTFVVMELAYESYKWEMGFWTALYNMKKHNQ